MQSRENNSFPPLLDPQEQRQEVLIKRVANSVERLSQAISDLSTQMEVGLRSKCHFQGVLQYYPQIDYLEQVWSGCKGKMVSNVQES